MMEIIILIILTLWFVYIYGNQVITYYKKRDRKALLTYLMFLLVIVGHSSYTLLDVEQKIYEHNLDHTIEVEYFEMADTNYICTKQYDVRICEVVE